VICPRPQGAFYAFPDISVAFGKSHNGKRRSTTMSILRRAAGSEGRRLRAGFGIRRAARDAHFLHLSHGTAQPGLDRITEFFAELT
jgi:aspartate aminotransferase